MMISPESYYEEYLKGKTKEQITIKKETLVRLKIKAEQILETQNAKINGVVRVIM